MPKTKGKVDFTFADKVDLLDAVTSLHTYLAHNLTGGTNTTSLSPLIAHLAPLILDTSSQVRSELLKLLDDLVPQVVSKAALKPHLSMLLLYIQSAMTHIQNDIRSDSTKFIAWALDVGEIDVIRESWSKVLSSYAGLLGWSSDGRDKTRVQLSRAGGIASNIKVTSRHLNTLYTFISLGISDIQKDTQKRRPPIYSYETTQYLPFYHLLTENYLLPGHSAPFAHLNLFGQAPGEQLSSLDVTSRRQVFGKYLDPVLRYLHDLAAENVNADISLHRNPVAMDLCISIIRILSIIKRAFFDVEDQEPRKEWEKEWNRCLKKLSGTMDGVAAGEGTRKLLYEWEAAGLGE